MRWAGVRIQHHKITAAVPNKFLTCQEVFNLERVIGMDAKPLQRDISETALAVKRVEIHKDENDIVQCFCRLGIEDDLFVLHRVKPQVLVIVQCAIVATNAIKLRYIFLDIARSVPVSFLELVLLGIQIFFLTWNRHVLAKLESAVDPIDRRKRCGENRTNQKGRTPSRLKKCRQDVGGIRKEI